VGKHKGSENGRGAWVALYVHPTHTDTDTDTSGDGFAHNIRDFMVDMMVSLETLRNIASV
jgi:hypothetical protein